MSIDNLALSNDVIGLLEDLGQTKSADKNIKIAIATALFASKSVSLTRGAEIAEVPLVDFINLLSHKDITWSEYTESDLMMDKSFMNDMN